MPENYIEKARKVLATKIEVEPDLLDLYVLIVFLKGSSATLRDIHEAWAVWKNKTKPDHKSLIPFEQLSKEVQDLDMEYTQAIQETAQELFVL